MPGRLSLIEAAGDKLDVTQIDPLQDLIEITKKSETKTYVANPIAVGRCRVLVYAVGSYTWNKPTGLVGVKAILEPNSVTDVFTFTGSEETSDGGYLVDDSTTINALAEVIAKSLLLTRKSVSWSSTRKISSIAVGDLITTAGGATVGAPIEAIHIKAPVSVGKPAKPTMQSFEVYRGKLDPIGLLKRLGGKWKI